MNSIKEYWFKFLFVVASAWFYLKNQPWKAIMLTFLAVILIRTGLGMVVWILFHTLVPGILGFVISLILWLVFYPTIYRRVYVGGR